jgi:cytosine/adenosine deaminase-related metal-dependent hydrolase
MRTITCAHALTVPDRPVIGASAIDIESDTIAAARPLVGGGTTALLAMPVLVNAHDHGRPVRSSSIGAGGKPLETWLNYLALFPSVDPYLAAVVALGRAALGGAGVVMVHYTRAQGFTDLPREVVEVARAAADVGVRVGFAVAMRDRNPLIYGDEKALIEKLPAAARAEIGRCFLREPVSPKRYIALVDEVANATSGAMFDVQYGPNGVQWCSNALLVAVAEASQRTGRRVHMHLLETRYQRTFLDREFPGGVVKHLDAIGLLSPRLTLAHCIWARPEELELLAERGVTIAVSNSSNLHLRSGLAPMAQMLRKGCRLALGVDGKALDEDDDALRELRLAHLLHAGTGFKPAASREQMLAVALANGRLSVTNRDDGGAIVPGAPADLLLLDWAAIDDDKLREDVDVLDLVLTRATARHIHELIVAGRTVVRDGVVTGVDLAAARAEILGQMRAAMPARAALAAVMPALDAEITRFYEPDCSCG